MAANVFSLIFFPCVISFCLHLDVEKVVSLDSLRWFNGGSQFAAMIVFHVQKGPSQFRKVSDSKVEGYLWGNRLLHIIPKQGVP